MPNHYAQQWDDLLKWDAASWKKLYKDGFDYTFYCLGRNVSFEEKDIVFVSAIECFQDKLLTGKIKREYAPNAFLKGIIWFKCLEFWRQKKLLGGWIPPPTETDDLPFTEEDDLQAFQEEIALACFHALQPDCQQVLLMTISEDKNHDEVAETLGISSKFVRVKKHRCMNYLKSCLSRPDA